jgi:hypothetical protein
VDIRTAGSAANANLDKPNRYTATNNVVINRDERVAAGPAV